MQKSEILYVGVSATVAQQKPAIVFQHESSSLLVCISSLNLKWNMLSFKSFCYTNQPSNSPLSPNVRD